MILATSFDPEKGISESHRILITTIARTKNSGMKYNDDRTELLETGEAPMLIEPVRINMEIKRKGNFSVSVLDHLGRKNGTVLHPKGRKFTLDGSENGTFYYLVEFK